MQWVPLYKYENIAYLFISLLQPRMHLFYAVARDQLFLKNIVNG